MSPIDTRVQNECASLRNSHGIYRPGGGGTWMRHVRQVAVRLRGIGEHDHIPHCSYPRREVGEEERQSQGEEVVVLR